MQTINFIFFGRLCDEKGFDLVLKLIDKYKNNNKVFFNICGKGIYQEELTKRNHSNLKYHGWTEGEKLDKIISESQYCLMPSKCIETFGLTALQALEKGVPVIGSQKGGCGKFIFNNFDINRQKGETEFDKLSTLCQKLINSFKIEDWHLISKECKQISTKFSKDIWLQKFQNLTNKDTKKILLVSDYILNLGGIESYIYNVKEILEKSGYEVDMIGWEGKDGKLTNKDRYIGMIKALLNIPLYLKLRKKIKKLNPDLVRYHSTIRYIGWLGILASKGLVRQVWTMYHDLGYFHPFPSKVTEEKEVKKLNVISFLKTAKTKNPLILIQVFIKYIGLKLLILQTKKLVDLNLVPSDFMEKYLSEYWGIEDSKNKTFDHFI